MCSHLIQIEFIISGNSVVKSSIITPSEIPFYFMDRCSLLSAPESAEDTAACSLWLSFLSGLKCLSSTAVAG